MIPRVYVDTSVIGGCFDGEFAADSRALLKMAESARALLLISELLTQELANAPVPVRKVITDLPASAVELVTMSAEAIALQEAYLKARVVGKKQANDALHVALATVARADLILSWNFKHIVHWNKIRGFNAVNLKAGYGLIEIRSPEEFV